MPRPVVSLPRDFAMDLHHLNENLWYLHFIDEFFRFSTGATIRNKHPNTVTQIFLKQWINIFGTPNSIYSDNGGEYVPKDVIDFCENFNIKTKTTRDESAWSNGICEHHNAIITEMLLKMKNDCQCDWETALAWAFSAKNCLINVNGFSPHQIVFGKKIALPSIFTDQPSADLPENEIVIKHLNTLHATRQAFITAESSRKLKLALRKQTRNTRGFLKLVQKFTLNEISIKNGVVLVTLSDRTAQLFILDKVEYCTKLIAHAQNSLLISNIHQHSVQSI